MPQCQVSIIRCQTEIQGGKGSIQGHNPESMCRERWRSSASFLAPFRAVALPYQLGYRLCLQLDLRMPPLIYAQCISTCKHPSTLPTVKSTGHVCRGEFKRHTVQMDIRRHPLLTFVSSLVAKVFITIP